MAAQGQFGSPVNLPLALAPLARIPCACHREFAAPWRLDLVLIISPARPS